MFLYKWRDIMTRNTSATSSDVKLRTNQRQICNHRLLARPRQLWNFKMLCCSAPDVCFKNAFVLLIKMKNKWEIERERENDVFVINRGDPPMIFFSGQPTRTTEESASHHLVHTPCWGLVKASQHAPNTRNGKREFLLESEADRACFKRYKLHGYSS